MKIATFSTRYLQEQCRKSYVASYQVNKESVGDLTNILSRTTSMKVIRESFLLWMIPNIWYFFTNVLGNFLYKFTLSFSQVNKLMI